MLFDKFFNKDKNNSKSKDKKNPKENEFKPNTKKNTESASGSFSNGLPQKKDSIENIYDKVSKLDPKSLNFEIKEGHIGADLIKAGLTTKEGLKKMLYVKEIKAKYQKLPLGIIGVYIGEYSSEEFLQFCKENSYDAKIGEMLLIQNKITKDQLEKALKLQEKHSNQKLGKILIKTINLHKKDILEALAINSGMVKIRMEDVNLNDELLMDISIKKLMKYKFLPVAKKEIENPKGNLIKEPYVSWYKYTIVTPYYEKTALDKIKQTVKNQGIEKNEKYTLEYRLLSNLEFESLFEKAKEKRNKLILAKYKNNTARRTNNDNSVINLSRPQNYSHVKQQFIKLLSIAIDKGASDMFVSYQNSHYEYKLRVDGQQQKYSQISMDVGGTMIKSILAESGMDAISRDSQNMEFSRNVIYQDKEGNNIEYKIRVSASAHQETKGVNTPLSLSIRILPNHLERESFRDLGMPSNIGKTLNTLLGSGNSGVFCTGPTGGGKTTTLYSILSKLPRNKRILTIENPIEYSLPGIEQYKISSNEEQLNKVKKFLRQDPDVLVTSEVRGKLAGETLSAMLGSGHLALSTLHTGSSVGTIARMKNLGIDALSDHDLSIGILNQTLTPILCDKCKKEYQPSQNEIQDLSDFFEDVQQDLNEGKIKFYTKGTESCRHCDKKRTNGRTGIFELLVVNDTIKKAIKDNVEINKIKHLARQTGMVSKYEMAYWLASKGRIGYKDFIKELTSASISPLKRSLEDIDHLLEGQLTTQEKNKYIYGLSKEDKDKTENKNESLNNAQSKINYDKIVSKLKNDKNFQKSILKMIKQDKQFKNEILKAIIKEK